MSPAIGHPLIIALRETLLGETIIDCGEDCTDTEFHKPHAQWVVDGVVRAINVDVDSIVDIFAEATLDWLYEQARLGGQMSTQRFLGRISTEIAQQ